MPKVITDFLEELRWRGLIHQCTDEKGLAAHLADPDNHPRAAYIGYDPTADSLTIGNLVTIMMLVHFQRAGHQPVVLMGGGTGLIGDPSGKSAERQLLSDEIIRENVSRQQTIFGRIFQNAAKVDSRAAKEPRKDFAPPIVNNIDWLGEIRYIDLLRDIGKYFPVNEMLKRDSVSGRIDREQGISYTEFSYMILQSYDFYRLHNHFAIHGLPLPVTLQMGGSDQWGNIISGISLIGRLKNQPEELLKYSSGSGISMAARAEWDRGRHAVEPFGPWNRSAFGVTCPLVTKADGGKFGKTESGAVWLTEPRGDEEQFAKNRTNPYAYYQFWLNTADADVGKFLRIFTIFSERQVLDIERQHKDDPSRRIAQYELAKAATFLLHGDEGVQLAQGASGALFGAGAAHLRSLSLDALTQAFAAAPTSQHARALLEAPGGLALTDLLPATSLAKSKTEARTLLTEGSISVNGELVPKDSALARRLTPADLLHGHVIALRRGKKNWHITRWQ